MPDQHSSPLAATARFLLAHATADSLRTAARAVDACDQLTAGLGAETASGARLGAIVAALASGRPQQTEDEADDIDGTSSPSPPAGSPTTDSPEVRELKAVIRDAQASAPRRPAKRRKGRPPKPWADSSGNLLPDWTDETGTGYLCQRRAAEALFLNRHQLIDLEARGRLTRVYCADGRRVGYSLAELDALTEVIRKVNERMAAADAPTVAGTA